MRDVLLDPTDPEAHSSPVFWRVEKAENFSMIVDAAEYFGALRQAMLDAEHSILLVGWDFDGRIRFVRDANPPEDGGPEQLDEFILWLAKTRPNLRIKLLRWGTGALASMLRPSTLWTVLRWKAHRQITLRLDNQHPFAGSHHQKLVAIDDRIAFCGGIDTTINRWDTRDHLDDDPRRIGPNGRQHDPWHDVSSVFDGPAAAAIGDLARARWARATGKVLPPCPPAAPKWPRTVAVDATGVNLGIARSIPKFGDDEAVTEVERAAIALIGAAERYIYVENQYFASRRLATAIASRLVEPDGPEVVVVCPRSAEGWLEPLAMNTARTRLMQALARVDTRHRLRLVHPVTEGGKDIYVHAKVMVVDDRYFRVGSSNFNNRSMRLDSECDVVLLGDGRPELAEQIARMRDDLLAEHLGVPRAAVSEAMAETGSLIETIERLSHDGRGLRPYEAAELTGIEEWLADNEILDPDGPDEMFEVSNRRGLFRGWREIARKKIHLRNGKGLGKRLSSVRKAFRRKLRSPESGPPKE